MRRERALAESEGIKGKQGPNRTVNKASGWGGRIKDRYSATVARHVVLQSSAGLKGNTSNHVCTQIISRSPG